MGYNRSYTSEPTAAAIGGGGYAMPPVRPETSRCYTIGFRQVGRNVLNIAPRNKLFPLRQGTRQAGVDCAGYSAPAYLRPACGDPMRILTTFLALAVLSAPAFASEQDPVVIYPYQTINYCPAGLQPVSYDGSISCGIATSMMTYQQATAAGSHSRRYRTGRACTAGGKGC